MENFSSECGREKSEYGPKNKTKISLSLSNISSSFPGKKSPRVHSLSADSNESSCWCTERTRRNNGFWLVPNDVIPFSITQVPFYTFHYAKVESRKKWPWQNIPSRSRYGWRRGSSPLSMIGHEWRHSNKKANDTSGSDLHSVNAFSFLAPDWPWATPLTKLQEPVSVSYQWPSS